MNDKKNKDYMTLNASQDRADKVRAVEEYLKKEKYKNFNRGVVLGVCITAVVFVSVLFSGVLPIGNTDFKLNALQKIVDKYYLFQDYVDEDAAKEATYKGYINSLGDPYSEYMNKEEFETFSRELEGKFYGIGVVFTMDYSKGDGYAKVVRVLEGYSADKAGVKSGDILTAVNGKPLKSMSQSEIVQLLKGEKGTKVDVTYYRESTGKTYTSKMVRQEVKEKTVNTKILEDGAGYIEVSSFSRDTDKEFKEAVDKMVAADVPGIIIDLRNNPGGLMDSCIEMLDYLLPKGTLVTTKYKDGSTDKATSDEKHQVNIPISIIINGMSASASEMFTGAMQDYDKAIVVGTQSFGKGIVQNIYPLKDGSAVKITNAEYLTPKNRRIHKKGITPDVKVKDSRTSILDENDAQLRAAQKSLKNNK